MADKYTHPRIAAIEHATRQFDKARKAVEQAIFDAYRDPTVKRTEIAPASPWTPAHVRKLARDEGIGPDPAYAQRTETARKRAAEAATEHAPPTGKNQWEPGDLEFLPPAPGTPAAEASPAE